ncbi:Gfo/Idh/MocA family oxidoreductase [Candidatus Poribacteria bacterium]|nr:Gfo/Idh/MocA family oxidoreductase [Candidatus Poribacteria bacterium]
MKKYRIAIIGLGGMGGHHAQAAALETNCELVAGAEINPERAKAWGERFGVKAIYDDYEKMLDKQKPDIVIVPTQAPMHYPPTIAAAKRGIHVFCEKPIALNLIQADEMVETCDKYHVKFAINHIKRASLYNRYVLSLIEKGEIGDVVLMKATDKGGRKAGNSLMEMGTHLYDWVRLFGGDVEWTHAHLVQMDGRESVFDDIKHTQEVHPHDRDSGLVLGERGHVSFRFKNGIHADVQFLAQPQTNDNAYGIDIIGTEGRIAIRESVGTTMFIYRGQHQTPAQAWEPVHLPDEDIDEKGNQRDQGSRRLFLQRLMLRDLMEAIEEDREPFASGRDGRDCLEMIHATWESHRQKGRVSMPLTPREHPLERWKKDASSNAIN